MPTALAATDATLVQDTLENLARCAKLFVDALDERRIQLADDTVPAALLLMARHFEQAAKGSRERRFQVLRALASAQVRERCEKLIEEATHRTSTVHGHEFVGWLECEGI
ncbi:MAG TPA: hypothetical protein VG759_25240 [Candidatus Angelobacter sp.]|jgi:hypothetical protein|nr:hypothetical protein [Candidatus Angelobacter sp.]